MMNKVSENGNMYQFVTHTWNTIKGECPHNCAYCYMKRWGKQPELHFDEKELKTDLGSGNFIFVGSSCDMWAYQIPINWIIDTAAHCRYFNKNKYLFQTKNSIRLYNLRPCLPQNVVLGTTIETNRSYPEMGIAPDVKKRAWGMFQLNSYGFETMITVEPIMDFDLDKLVGIIKFAEPKWVNIGANTNSKVKLPGPKPDKVKELITALKEFTEVKVKSNLKRLEP